jgi:hypothetical protein
VVWNDRLPVTWKGRVIEVGGDDPRAAAISRVIASGQPLPPTLAKLGIGWIVVQRDQPAVTRPVDLRGAEVMSRDGELELWRVDVPVQPHDASDPLLITVNIVVAFFVVGGAMIVGSRRWRHARV